MQLSSSAKICAFFVASVLFSVCGVSAANGDRGQAPMFVWGGGDNRSHDNNKKLIEVQVNKLQKLEAQRPAFVKLRNLIRNDKITDLGSLNRAISNLNALQKEVLGDFLDEHESEPFGDLRQVVQKHIENIDLQIHNCNAFLNTSQGIIGRAAYKGFAGRNSILFNDMTPSGLMEGLGAGFAYRTMSVVGDKFEEVIRLHGGEIFDTVAGGFFRKVKNKFLSGWYWLFNGGCHPYTLEQINLWQNEVKQVILNNLDKSAKTAQGDQANGFGTRARVQHKMDSILFDDAGATDTAAVATPVDPTWVEMVNGLARDLDRLTVRMDIPKMHYAPGSESDEKQMVIDGRADILDMATRIQETLQLIKLHILLPTRALKDLAAGDLKQLLPRLIFEIDQRFELFKSAVSHYHGSGLKAAGVSGSYDSGKINRQNVRGDYGSLDAN